MAQSVCKRNLSDAKEEPPMPLIHSLIMGKYDGASEAEIVKANACDKRWRRRKIKTVWHMIQSLGINFNLSSYNKLKKELNVLDRQIYSIQDISKLHGDIK